jgi:hypothetical protein
MTNKKKIILSIFLVALVSYFALISDFLFLKVMSFVLSPTVFVILIYMLVQEFITDKNKDDKIIIPEFLPYKK